MAPISRGSIFEGELVPDDLDPITRAYRNVVIYTDADSEDVLYEGPIIVHPNGWLELEGNRLLSPNAVHHVDIYDDETESNRSEDGNDADGDDRRRDGSRDDDRTNRFSPR
ncbi:hypothetical protein [Natronobacterium gregoryi]|uniref:Uncharacterized protein n=2 Tax=Natronobacterium gregoryi TaxID=44930 RepID=L0ACR6_NATGS|nr:hypothetical protein [Natronobacterium gregoryi]AFZ71631.1 hypothetical protein Natgr_0375 [Natronobacterium gregoryi SP2]ELY66686.1 hypothetical protein C490_12977 [Natronobacterium gregoryi SP2]PLK21396.1 hypothetical protein CYV19_05005 [Natronobacterium gregoryi SP2]SFI80051.1 hypothetical protein SAMN05443661_10611 [Natronobacterium gregoryi]